jgi:hypothetical protein
VIIIVIIIIIIITNDKCTWNITHNTESTAALSLKPDRWATLLVQEKYREEKACDKRHPYRIITITTPTTTIIITITIIILCEEFLWKI